MFRKNKYATNYSSCQYCATAQSSFCLQEGSSVLTCCTTISAVTEGLLHRMVWSNAWNRLSPQHLWRSALPAAGWHASAIASERPLTASLFAISFAPKSVFVLVLWQTDWALPISVFQVRMPPWAVACFLTSQDASHSSPPLMSPGPLWWWVSSCTAPDRIQIPKTVDMSYSPLGCKLSSVLHWSRYAWLLEYSAQSCSWFGSLCLSEIQEKGHLLLRTNFK